MQNIKDNIHQKLIITGRDLVKSKGVEFLTARKLSEASGCSIGTIYNQFASMDDFIAEQNEITMLEMIDEFDKIKTTPDNFKNLNFYIDVFSNYVLKNREIWNLLYGFHLNNKEYKLSIRYKKLMLKISDYCYNDFNKLFLHLDKKRSKLMREALVLGLFAISSLLSTTILDNRNKINKNNICRIFSNTFLAGITLLERE
ncbi:MAG: TetR/AcrR family transcriptional regulator [Alphaproteobacteria bacterium]|nr:TetR/AcrR family transcriptional regulator [Alphaproteobacteria bacterium]